jgi:hypothetical protein
VGCLRQLFVQVGCVVLVLAGAALAFVYREQLADVYRRLRGEPAPVEVVYVVPEPGGARAAVRALEQLARPRGPAFVDLSAGQLAALIDDLLSRAGRRVFDSVQVALGNDEVRVKGSLDVREVPRNLLGPLRGAIGPFEPLAVGGPLAVDSAGRVRWRITSLSIRDFPFPRSTLPALVRQLRIPDATDGSVPIPDAGTVGDVRVAPAGVRLYRRSP